MPTGAITGYIDVAQLVLYAFWIFFAGLVIYLRREDKREGYPLESDRTRNTDRVEVQGFPAIPKPKTFRLEDGKTVMRPDRKPDSRPIQATPTAGFPGAPLMPTGNPMTDAVGPASYAERADEPDPLFDGSGPKIAPLRVATDFHVLEGDPDPRGMEVRGADGKVAGTVVDIWVDRPDSIIRYLEVDVGTQQSAKRVLLPFFLSRISGNMRQHWVSAKSVLAEQFQDAPTVRNPDQVTKLEEDRICAYFGSGHLYATRQRQEPLL